MSKMNTVISYMYRDGSNYKTRHAVTLNGLLGAEVVKAIMAKARDSEFFIPGQVGLKDLQDSFPGCNSQWIEGDDTPWHEIEDISDEAVVPSAEAPLAAEFAEKFLSVVWDEEYRPAFYAEMAARRATAIKP